MTTVPTTLVVDLDGTLTYSDTLVESVVDLIKRSPLSIFRLPIWVLRGRVYFKNMVASKADITVASLPFNVAFVNYLHEQKSSGRRIVLATAAHESVANKVANHFGIFDDIIATGSGANIKGANKLAAIKERVGDEFVYAGNSRADLPIWESASAAVLVNAVPSIAVKTRQITKVEKEFPKEQDSLRTWLRLLRVHQWVKNLLIFVPLFTAFSFVDVGKVAASALAFLAFSFAASATYIINDLFDLDSDRLHPTKRLRPLASGNADIVSAIAASGVLVMLAVPIASLISKNFLIVLLFYFAVTLSYSWFLKRFVLIDIVVLALLYTLRVFAGAVAIEVEMSAWLLAFSVFLFFSLALIKRCAELVSLRNAGLERSQGRGYYTGDLAVLWPLGVGAAVSAIVVFGLFANSPETTSQYTSPILLWLVAPGLIYWLSRLWLKTVRGEMHDDPIVFAIKDNVSIAVVLFMIVIVLCAHFIAV